MKKSIRQRLAILSDAAKYDASCASSGTAKRNSAASGGLGSTEGSGICHAYAPDGRCISLLKILLTNFCIYDCAYCINRSSSNVERARFTAEEVVWLTLEFYRRNYIEGLFLSSGIIRSSDHTMEEMVRVARELRVTHGFRGYIHLKSIPEASPKLIEEAGLYADRLSINIELPTDSGIGRFAPEKQPANIRRSMADIRLKIEEAGEPTVRTRKTKRFAPAGQSTQMIVGADGADDSTILSTSARLYGSYGLRRVYYSAFSPIPDSSKNLPLIKPPLMREHRLYQADWLYRFYGFDIGEITAIGGNGMLDLDIDPKLAWALKHRDQFPVNVNAADREMLLRVPGFGTKTVASILSSRKFRSLRLEDIARFGVSLKKVKAFIVAEGWTPGKLIERPDLRAMFAPQPEQLSLL
ncbi:MULTISPECIES: putative DNA modification/repair radical SAM protein [Rhizobium/Agrobacterium group]|jgi:putative DNA modification/repair radical SAM protein|uniref:putative DNA modification/repair radical SAM protein n=1 Tax=Rhizobium/Agrobacterium group TaxID=227290 RepID=UPI000458C974|nr:MULTISPECIES: putative DNA modification/repair radical SAM protein [Rhizobium/Agrobacterium group]AMD59721.1 radical SAM protein [Agrobacterium tumefaciens]MBB2907408.1 putative DNA modification/repair radical SAM protein [Rhizobium sp. RAS22]PZU78585.1 MAG: putative DNA modification/repair radical SAM protein [Rhizobium sp.]KAJ34699.1 radical SAM protein [Agrobacterium tumefaciens]MBW9066795.1 putative DNA modification/repair radical SAM protein [Agrobacterium pusense]